MKTNVLVEYLSLHHTHAHYIESYTAGFGR